MVIFHSYVNVYQRVGLWMMTLPFFVVGIDSISFFWKKWAILSVHDMLVWEMVRGCTRYVQATANSFLVGIGFSSQAKSGKFNQQSRGLHGLVMFSCPAPATSLLCWDCLPKNNRSFRCEGEDAQHGNYMELYGQRMSMSKLKTDMVKPAFWVLYVVVFILPSTTNHWPSINHPLTILETSLTICHYNHH